MYYHNWPIPANRDIPAKGQSKIEAETGKRCQAREKTYKTSHESYMKTFLTREAPCFSSDWMTQM